MIRPISARYMHQKEVSAYEKRKSRPLRLTKKPRLLPLGLILVTMSAKICFHAALNKAVQLGYILRNPIGGIKLPRVKKTVRVMNEEQVQKLLAAARNENIRYYVIVLLALATGMRRAEIFGLMWDDIDLKKAKYLCSANCADLPPPYGQQRNLGSTGPENAYSYRRIPLPADVVPQLKRL